MKLENQVTSLELSKQLKTLGVKQESLYVWRHWRSNGEIIIDNWRERWFDYPKHEEMEGQTEFIASAFTVAELGENIKNIQSLKQLQHHADVAARGNYLFDADYWATVLIYLLEKKLT